MHSSTVNPPDDAKAQTETAPLSEASLRSSLTMLQQVVDHLPQAIGWKDKSATFLGCNQAFAKAVGLPHPADIVGKAAMDMQWQNHPAPFLHDRDRALITQQKAEYHQLHELPGAEQLPGVEQSSWLEISHIPLCDEHGLCTGMLTVIDDATARKQAEETLRQSEATNRALINAVPDLLFRIRRDETYLDVQSSKSFKVLNSDQLIIGAKVSNSLPPDLAQKRMHYVQKALSTGELQIYEQELVIGGETTYEEVRIVPCQADEVMAMVRDITDRKQAEASFQLTQFAVDHAADPIWWVRKDCTIAYINEAGCRDLGRPREEILGFKVSDFNPDISMETWDDLWQTVKKLGAFTFETRNRHKNGTFYPVEVAVNYIELNGKEYQCAFVRNITERKTVEEALKMTQFSVDRASDPVWWIESDGSVAYINDAACRAVGYTREEMLVRRVYDFDPEFTADLWVSHWQDLQERGSFTFETSHQHKSGRIFPVEVTVNYIDVNGKAFNCAFVRDITDRKQAEAALQITQFSVDHAADPIWWVRPDCTIAYINEAGCRDLGRPREEILGFKVSDFNPDISMDMWDDQWQTVKKLGAFTFETRNRHKDGTFYPVEVAINYIELNGQEYQCAFVRNITERKKAEVALRESEQQMREQAHRERLLNRLVSRIRDSLNFDTILETTLQEVQNFTEADRCQFVWYQPDQEESYWEVVKETRAEHLPNLVNRYPVSPTSPLLLQLLDLQILRVEDVETLSESSLLRFMRRFDYKAMLAIPMRMQSGVLGTIFCCNSTQPQDWSESAIELIQAVMAQLAIALTQADLYTQSRTKAKALDQPLRELKATQTQMVQSEKMSSLGQLVAGVAHEINNPVNFIYGNLSHATSYTQDLLHLVRLYQQHYSSPVQEIQAVAEAIDLDFLLEDLPKLMLSMRVGADRIQKIVLALRNFSRMDEADVKQVDIHEGIDSTLMILQGRLKGKAGQVGIEVKKDYGQLPLVECYPGQLNQVFMNILSNAIDALEEEASEDDRPSVIRIQTEYLNSESIIIRIADNGCGMTQEQQKRLFDPFFTTKPIGKGTGLGLSISYQIVVQKHGGTLTCSSTLGEGTEFCIEIPVQPAG